VRRSWLVGDRACSTSGCDSRKRSGRRIDELCADTDLHRIRHHVDSATGLCERAAMGAHDFTKLTPKERLRFWADLGAKEAIARGELAKYRASMEAMALQIGAELLDVQDGRFCWTGKPTEVVIADRPEFEDLDGDEAEAEEGNEETGAWPVNIEKDLLARMRAAKFDLEDALVEHESRFGDAIA
jgi:hypothetical protein